MIRYLLATIAALFLLRIFFRIARAIFGSGSDQRSAPRDAGWSGSDASSKNGKSRVRAATERERSDAIEVPFTEIPPEEPARRP